METNCGTEAIVILVWSLGLRYFYLHSALILACETVHFRILNKFMKFLFSDWISSHFCSFTLLSERWMRERERRGEHFFYWPPYYSFCLLQHLFFLAMLFFLFSLGLSEEWFSDIECWLYNGFTLNGVTLRVTIEFWRNWTNTFSILMQAHGSLERDDEVCPS